MPRLGMNNHTPGDHQLHFRVLRTPDTEEVIPQIELRINPQVGLTQSHKGRYV
jgi:hypothetical protein